MGRIKLRPPFQPCAYCAKRFARVETEHVFPNSWYPDHYLGERITVPSCPSCNDEYEKIEHRLWLPLIAGLPPGGPTQTVFERAVDDIDPRKGRSVSGVGYRNQRNEGFFGRVTVAGMRESVAEANWSPTGRLFGSFTTPAGLFVTGTPVVTLGDDMHALLIKFVKGCYFKITGTPLPSTTAYSTSGFSRDPRPVLEDAINRGFQVHGQWPFECAVLGQGTGAIWFFILWGFHVYCASSDLAIVTRGQFTTLRSDRLLADDT